jgi:hypothetical protein
VEPGLYSVIVPVPVVVFVVVVEVAVVPPPEEVVTDVLVWAKATVVASAQVRQRNVFFIMLA